MPTPMTLIRHYIEESPAVTEAYLLAPLQQSAEALVAQLRTGRPVVVTGCGTSYHLALLAARYLQAVAGLEAWAVPSFDLAWSLPFMARDKLVLAISHSGASKATLDAVHEVRRFGPLIAGLSANAATPLAKACDLSLTFPGGWEHALPKTRIFTAGAVQLLRLANEAADAGNVPAALPAAAEMRRAMDEALAHNRRELARAVEAWKRYTVYAFVGGGPAWAVACEIALKMRENNYAFAEGYEAEEMTHGRTSSFEPDRPVVGFYLHGPSLRRVADCLATASYLGAPTMAVVEEGVQGVPEADFTLRIPRAPSEFAAAILAALPLQLFSHDISIARGIDPDSIRLDDRHHAYAQARWIFPPGTH
ncbi:MAG: SIS domain-containing protein [Chloroflexi bacterium]|nr:SIS domain-containing protein [Chloroflexota bacterium]